MGKSSIAQRFVHDSFRPAQESTIGYLCMFFSFVSYCNKYRPGHTAFSHDLTVPLDLTFYFVNINEMEQLQRST